ncbi:hypothetical protein ACA910_010946 [Epithemia clementina (nom. ined.)]
MESGWSANEVLSQPAKVGKEGMDMAIQLEAPSGGLVWVAECLLQGAEQSLTTGKSQYHRPQLTNHMMPFFGVHAFLSRRNGREDIPELVLAMWGGDARCVQWSRCPNQGQASGFAKTHCPSSFFDGHRLLLRWVVLRV